MGSYQLRQYLTEQEDKHHDLSTALLPSGDLEMRELRAQEEKGSMRSWRSTSSKSDQANHFPWGTGAVIWAGGWDDGRYSDTNDYPLTMSGLSGYEVERAL